MTQTTVDGLAKTVKKGFASVADDIADIKTDLAAFCAAKRIRRKYPDL